MGTPIVNLNTLIDDAVTSNTDVIQVQTDIDDFSNITVPGAITSINTHTTNKTNEFDVNVTSKTNDYNANHTNKIAEVQAIVDSVSTSTQTAIDKALEASMFAGEASDDADQTTADRLAVAADLVTVSGHQLDVTNKTNLVYGYLQDAEAAAQTAEDARDVIEMIQEVYPTRASMPATGVLGKTYVVEVDETNNNLATAYVWNSVSMEFVIFNGSLTDVNIKTAYENNPNTNAFTDSEKTKLSGIESGATADQTGAEIKTAYESEADTNAFTDAEKTKLGTVNVTDISDNTAARHTHSNKAILDNTTASFTSAEEIKLSNLPASVYSQSETDTRINNAVTALVDSAPATLDTLDELANALGDDPNFATTVTTSIGLKANSADIVLKNHGIQSGCEFSVNVGDANTYDVSAGVYWIDGVKYTFSGVTGRPSVGLAGSFASVGLNASGIIDIASNFIDADLAETTLEITAYAKLTDTTIDNVGSSKDDMSEFIKNMYLRMKYYEETLFKNGAAKVTASVTPLQMNMASGTVSAPNGSRVGISDVTDFGANAIYNVSGTETIQPLVTPFIIDATVYDNGTDLVTIPTDSFVAHTMARSIRTGANYFIYGKTLHTTLGAAQSQEPDLGIFQATEEGSFIEPLALVIVRESVNDIFNIVDIRGGREANTIDSIAGKTITTTVSGDVMTFNGNTWIAQTPPSNAGQGISFFLGNDIIGGDNYNLSIFPQGGAEVEVQQTANSGDSPKFIERYVSDAIGGTSIDAGVWTFYTYASVDANQGNTQILARINKSVLKTGTLTSTGTGLTRTFTASEPGTFVPGDADASILNATLIQTPTETFFIDSYISDTQVTATTDQAGYVNETGVAFSLFYKLFQVTAADDITGTEPALYEVPTVQPAFAVNPEDKILIAYFMSVSTAANKTISLYKNGTDHYSSFDTPLVYRHNNLSGLNEGDYQHITQTEKTKYEAYDSRITTVQNEVNAMGVITEW